jgi:hypothetical protein
MVECLFHVLSETRLVENFWISEPYLRQGIGPIRRDREAAMCIKGLLNGEGSILFLQRVSTKSQNPEPSEVMLHRSNFSSSGVLFRERKKQRERDSLALVNKHKFENSNLRLTF